MRKEEIVSKTLIKLGFGPNGVISDADMAEFMKSFKKIFNSLKENDVEGPKRFLEYFEESIIKKHLYKKDQIQEILAKAKLDGLINQSISANVYMEKAWRTILKHYGLKGFILRT